MPDRFRDLVASTRDICAILDESGIITFASPAIQSALGLLPTEVGGNVLWELVHPNDVVSVHAALQEVLARGDRRSLEFEMLDVNGRWHRLDASLWLLEGAEPQAVGLVATDVTDWRGLEARVRTLEEQLRQAHKMEVVGRLASGIAHDFGNLLTIIIGANGRILDELPVGSPLRAHAQAIHEQADRSTALVRRLLGFGRQSPAAPTVLDLNSVVTDVAQLLRPLVGEHIDVQIVRADSVWPVKADRTQIEQVLFNLAANARDAMPSGGTLTIETGNVAATTFEGRAIGPSVSISVSDTGVGMDAATLSLAFEPFFTTKAIGEGTGLGLANVYAFVRDSGGWTTLQSELGLGTTLTFGLPRVYEIAVADPHKPSPPVGGTETILVVEDEDGVRGLVREFLALAGYQVLEATMPSEAERISREFDGHLPLLVTDVVMPEMSGVELSIRLREHRPDMQVMYMSGFPEPTAGGSGGTTAPGAHFVAKPFDRQTLLRAVRGALDAPPATR
ncbi:MAG: ATP-binding protein [Vicinamibacterales bacterium]